MGSVKSCIIVDNPSCTRSRLALFLNPAPYAHVIVCPSLNHTGKIIGGEWEWGDCGVMGSDDRLLGRAHPFRDGNGDPEEVFALVLREGGREGGI